MRKALKIILLIIFTLTIITSLSTKSFAAGTDDIIQGANGFINSGNPQDTPITEDNLKSVSNLIYNVLLAAAIIVMVIWGFILGIQFITGAVEEKAEVKKSLIPYVVGIVIVFSTFTIWKIVVTIMKQVA